MKPIAAFPLIAFAAPALAHPGHLVAEAGHSHWIALAATLAAVAVVVLGIARAMARRRRPAANDARE